MSLYTAVREDQKRAEGLARRAHKARNGIEVLKECGIVGHCASPVVAAPRQSQDRPFSWASVVVAPCHFVSLRAGRCRCRRLLVRGSQVRWEELVWRRR